MRIAVDFDGTLEFGDNFPEIGEPNLKLIEWLKNRRKSGDLLILLSLRENIRGHNLLDEAVEWCKGHGLEFDAVNENIITDFEGSEKFGGPWNTRKIAAELYIDDRSALPVRPEYHEKHGILHMTQHAYKRLDING